MKAEELLKSIERILASSNRGKKAVGKETISVTSAGVSTLTVPSGANSALITVEADATATNTTKVVRVWEDGSTPTTSLGVPIGTLDTYEVTHFDNLKNFKVIGVEAAKTTVLQVQYYYL